MSWRRQAACKDFPVPELFNVEKASNPAIADHLYKRYCSQCPVAQSCLDDALADPDRDGFYAGYNLQIEVEETE